jgi:hypothetical protein
VGLRPAIEKQGTTVYRDDVCAVCGESLPPDHFYCREHAAGVDDRLHEIGALLPRLADDAERLATLLTQVAGETWDYLAEQQPDDPDWPPAPAVELRADGDDIDVDVDSEPGFVTVRLSLPLADLLAAVAADLKRTPWRDLAAVTTTATGANATH